MVKLSPKATDAVQKLVNDLCEVQCALSEILDEAFDTFGVTPEVDDCDEDEDDDCDDDDDSE